MWPIVVAVFFDHETDFLTATEEILNGKKDEPIAVRAVLQLSLTPGQ